MIYLFDYLFKYLVSSYLFILSRTLYNGLGVCWRIVTSLNSNNFAQGRRIANEFFPVQNEYTNHSNNLRIDFESLAMSW